jgi:iron(III) transport system permease protein
MDFKRRFRLGTLPIELLILAFLAVFLLYPLGYVLPGSASDEVFEVRLTNLDLPPDKKAEVVKLLTDLAPGAAPMPLRFPQLLGEFPEPARAEQLKQRFDQATAPQSVVEVKRERRWTAFYFREALGFQIAGTSSFPFFRVVPNNPFLWECLRNSLSLAFITTVITTIVCIPLARWFTRYRFAGRTMLTTLLLVPLLLPPFVGAIGMERLLGRSGAFNQWFIQLGIIPQSQPVDWLGAGFAGVILMQVLHLYPILYLNMAAAWANIDPALEDAARNLGAGEFRIFRTITFPLLLPGYFAGATLVFVWSFTDLGTPLVFNVNSVIPVQIYNQVSDPRRTNPTAYALVVVTLVVTVLLFYVARWVVQRQAYAGGGKGAVASAPPAAGTGRTLLIHLTVLILTVLAVLPTIGVILTAFADRWALTPLPESYTTAAIQDVWSNRIASFSIRNSLLYSTASTLLNLVLGVTLAWLIARRPSWLTHVLDGLATLPLALPGLVLAFGYLTCYSNWDLGPARAFLDPARNPVFLLVIAYTVRRLPFLTRSAHAGLQQIAPVLEEAAENLGAGRWRVMRTITVPLIAANVVAGAILTFAFAVLEVSDSLMLAREEKYYPITRAILGLLMRPDDGDSIASALAVIAMGLLAVGLVTASLLLGRKMGELFRA